MQFNEKNHKVMIDTMNVAESNAFILFLQSEIERHKQDIDDAIELMMKVIENVVVMRIRGA